MFGSHGQHNSYSPHQMTGPGFSPGFASPPKPVGVFWDIENCPIPKGTAASSVVHFVRNSFVVNRLNHREYEFLVACDITKLRKDIPEDINRAGGVTLAHVSGSSKNAADEKLRESMKRFVDTHASLTPMLILISGDIDFVNDLRGFQTRMGCTIVVLHGATASQHFKIGWNEVYPFQDFLMRMPSTAIVVAVPNEATTPEIKKSDGGGMVMGPRGCPPQTQRPQFTQAYGTNMNPPGVRPQTPRPGAPPFVKAERNAVKVPATAGGFNAGVQQQQYGATALEGAPLSNRAQKKAQKIVANNNGAASGVSAPVTHQNQFMQNNTSAMPGGFNSNSNAGFIQAQQHDPTIVDGIPQSNRKQKRSQKFGQNAMECSPNSNTGPAVGQQQTYYPNQSIQNNSFGQGPGRNGAHQALHSGFPSQPPPFVQAAGKKNRQKSGPFESSMSHGPLQPGDQKWKGQGPSPQMHGAVDGANGPSKMPKQNIILMVSGLPGKMDFRILKDHLQNYANTVSGKVMYVHNGQGFITFKRKEDADNAIQLFQGREVYGNKLNIQLSKTIPFQNPRPEGIPRVTGGGQGPDGDFVMVDPNLQSSMGRGTAGQNMPSNSSSSNLLAEGLAAFATAAFKELSLQQGGQQGNNAGQKGKKKEKAKEDPNCVVQ